MTVNVTVSTLDGISVAVNPQLSSDIAGKIPLTQRGAANGVATLDADSKIPGSQLPSLAIGETFTVASQAAMLALTAQRGDVAVRTDLDPDGFFLLTADTPTVLGSWVQITAPGGVTSVDGQVGAVALSAYVPKAGGTMTGALVLPGNAASALVATPKQQVEALIAAIAYTDVTDLTSPAAAGSTDLLLLITGIGGTPTAMNISADVLRAFMGALEEGQVVRTGSNIGIAGGSSLFLTPSTLYARPFRIKKGGNLNQARIRVQTAAAAGGVVRTGLYTNNPTTNQPGALVKEFTSAATLDVSTTGTKDSTGFTQAVADSTTYWMVVVAQVASPSVQGTEERHPLLPEGSGGDTLIACYTYTGITGALPATLGPPANVNSRFPVLVMQGA